MRSPLFAVLSDERASATLERLHRLAGRQSLSLLGQVAALAPRWLSKRSVSWEALELRCTDKFLAIDARYGVFCYLLARALGARTIVEFGTSFGISTIYLALAVRDNGGGTVIGTELLESKAERAREHLREAGVADQVDLRVGDALQTLADVGDGVDMLLNDGYPRFALPVMQLVAPRMRPGAIALGANTGYMPGQHAEYLAWVRDRGNGFRSWALPMWLSGELSVKEQRM